MKHNILLGTLSLMFSFFAQAQQYSRVKINLEGKKIENLAKLGIEVDHGIFMPNRYLINDFSTKEIELIQKAGFEAKIEIEDMKAYYLSQNDASTERSIGDCEQQIFKETHKKPTNFKLGTMGGYYTYEELWAELDKMRALYPNLISTYQAIDTFKTHEKRPIRWLRISDNPNQEGVNEPKVLYTSLHHAREPLGLSQLVYYMWYLLENYASNPEIKQLLNNTELYFIPMINPDGYVFNQTNQPKGGGFWRKNRRDNKNGTFGVDLNRNYGYEWAFSDSGSSPNPDSDTYRGPSAFSEPETRAVKAFCEKYKFKIALNYHTFGNLLIYPWGYNDNLADPVFRDIGTLFSAENNYKAGTGIETVGYNVNGDSDDWMWGAKQIFAFTPEASLTGFWPAKTQIQTLCGEPLLMNIQAAQLVGSYATVRPSEVPVFLAKSGSFGFDIKRYGFDNQEFIFKIEPLTNNIESQSDTKKFFATQFQITDIYYNYSLKNTVKNGDLAKWLITLTDVKNTFVKYDTIKSYFGGLSVLKENGDNIANWKNIGSKGDWGLSKNIFKSAPSSISDSPSGNYEANNDAHVRSNNYISLPKKDKIILRFWAKWDIEKDADYAAVSISEDNFAYDYVCGKYTHSGGSFQLEAEPIYDGVSDWVLEEMNITEFAGKDILLRFSLVTDFQVNKDGMYIDDIEIVAENQNGATETITLETQDFEISTFPNPATSQLRIQLDSPLENANIHLYSAAGQLIQQFPLQQQITTLDVSNLAKGAYFYQIQAQNGEKTKAQRFMKL